MEKPVAKFFLAFLLLTAVLWLGASSMKNYHSGTLLKFGTVEFESSIDPAVERETYRSIAEYSAGTLLLYPFLLLFAAGYLKTTHRTFRSDGWLLMSAILFFLFIPVEIYCSWLDWKMIGLNYWGEWPIEEFRKAFLRRVTALAGLPLIAQMCYFTIPILVLRRPFSRIA